MDVLPVMNSEQIIFWLSAVISFIVMATIIRRSGQRPVQAEASNGVSLAGVLAPWLAAAAAAFVLVVKRLLAATYLFLLLFGHRTAATTKLGLHKIENRFLRLIEAVRGRRPSLPEESRAAASFFLEQIKADKLETARRSNNRLVSPS